MSSPRASTQERQARAVRGRCPVVQICLKWATDSRQDTGVWGGLSEDERHAPPPNAQPHHLGPVTRSGAPRPG